MTMATSVAGEENIFATSSLRKEFNEFVAKIENALSKKDEDFGDLKAKLQEIIENLEQPTTTPTTTSTATPAETEQQPAAENAAEN
jgi:hypothetical protein